MLRFVHISDTHIHADPDFGGRAGQATQQRLREAIAAIRQLPFAPAFILHTGDVVYDPDPAAYAAAAALFAGLEPPLIALAGNHDDAAMLAEYPFAAQPFAVHDLDEAVLVLIDSNAPAPPYCGCIPDEHLAQLAAFLKGPDRRPLIVALHHSVLPVGVPWLDERMRCTNGEALHALLATADRPRLVLHGHTHHQSLTVRDGIPYAGAASVWAGFRPIPPGPNAEIDAGKQPAFAVVSLADGTFSLTQHAILAQP